MRELAREGWCVGNFGLIFPTAVNMPETFTNAIAAVIEGREC